MTHIKCRESLTNVNITAFGEASVSCSLSEVVNDTEYVEVLDESFFLADDEAIQISLSEDKDNQGNGKSQVSQPKYAKRKETESRLNPWIWRENQRGVLIRFSYSEIRFRNKNIVKCLKLNAIFRQSIYFF